MVSQFVAGQPVVRDSDSASPPEPRNAPCNEVVANGNEKNVANRNESIAVKHFWKAFAVLVVALTWYSFHEAAGKVREAKQNINGVMTLGHANLHSYRLNTLKKPLHVTLKNGPVHTGFYDAETESSSGFLVLSTCYAQSEVRTVFIPWENVAAIHAVEDLKK